MHKNTRTPPFEKVAPSKKETAAPTFHTIWAIPSCKLTRTTLPTSLTNIQQEARVFLTWVPAADRGTASGWGLSPSNSSFQGAVVTSEQASHWHLLYLAKDRYFSTWHSFRSLYKTQLVESAQNILFFSKKKKKKWIMGSPLITIIKKIPTTKTFLK